MFTSYINFTPQLCPYVGFPFRSYVYSFLALSPLNHAYTIVFGPTTHMLNFGPYICSFVGLPSTYDNNYEPKHAIFH